MRTRITDLSDISALITQAAIPRISIPRLADEYRNPSARVYLTLAATEVKNLSFDCPERNFSNQFMDDFKNKSKNTPPLR
jgi:hypothetical protein